MLDLDQLMTDDGGAVSNIDELFSAGAGYGTAQPPPSVQDDGPLRYADLGAWTGSSAALDGMECCTPSAGAAKAVAAARAAGLFGSFGSPSSSFDALPASHSCTHLQQHGGAGGTQQQQQQLAHGSPAISGALPYQPGTLLRNISDGGSVGSHASALGLDNAYSMQGMPAASAGPCASATPPKMLRAPGMQYVQLAGGGCYYASAAGGAAGGVAERRLSQQVDVLFAQGQLPTKQQVLARLAELPGAATQVAFMDVRGPQHISSSKVADALNQRRLRSELLDVGIDSYGDGGLVQPVAQPQLLQANLCELLQHIACFERLRCSVAGVVMVVQLPRESASAHGGSSSAVGLAPADRLGLQIAVSGASMAAAQAAAQAIEAAVRQEIGL